VTEEVVVRELYSPEKRQLTEEQIDLVKRTIMPEDSSDDELALFIQVANRTGLDPFARQIYCTKRRERKREQVNGQWVDTWVPRFQIGIGIDGFRSIAERTGQFDGREGPFWCGPDGEWKEVWLNPEPPAAAKVVIHRKGRTYPVTGIALWKEYAPLNKNGQPQAMWGKAGTVMIAKCAEAIGLRVAFPQDLSGLYTADEMDQAGQERPETPTAVEPEGAPEPVAERKPASKQRKTKAEKKVEEDTEALLIEAGIKEAEEAALLGALDDDPGTGTVETPAGTVDTETGEIIEGEVVPAHITKLMDTLAQLTQYPEWSLDNVLRNCQESFGEQITALDQLDEEQVERVLDIVDDMGYLEKS
jgi:phage recombination protein Bet